MPPHHSHQPLSLLSPPRARHVCCRLMQQFVDAAVPAAYPTGSSVVALFIPEITNCAVLWGKVAVPRNSQLVCVKF